MFQRGTGERFKYKATSLLKFPNAKSQKRNVGGSHSVLWMFAIYVNDKRKSETFRRAEDAWADFWINHVKVD